MTENREVPEAPADVAARLAEFRDLARKAYDNGTRCSVAHYDGMGNPAECPDVVEMRMARTALLRRLPELVRICDEALGALGRG